MKRIAIIQFPGLNSELETKRAVDDAGMNGVIFRWNDDPMDLAKFDGFIIPGGFSYEDRGRAGLIPSLHPIMDVIREQVAEGKPLLGICNGAQVVIETALVPGSGKLDMCLANNKRIKNGEVVGTGFINFDKEIKATTPKLRCAFNLTIEQDTIHKAPIAHGEGRFTTNDPKLVEELEANEQIVFKYCDKDGSVSEEYPNNPNGALKNAAAICNKAGNVMAIMPHPERAFTAPIPEIFESMRVYLEEFFDKGIAMIPEVSSKEKSDLSIQSLQELKTQAENKFEVLVDLIITDNEAETFTSTLNQLGFEVRVRRQVHYTITHTPGADAEKLAIELIKSGELLNTNKETATIKIHDSLFRFNPNDNSLNALDSQAAAKTLKLYSRDREDFFGQSKTEKITKHLSIAGFEGVTQGTLWTVQYMDATIQEKEVMADNLNEALRTNIFANPHSQELYLYN